MCKMWLNQNTYYTKKLKTNNFVPKLSIVNDKILVSRISKYSLNMYKTWLKQNIYCTKKFKTNNFVPKLPIVNVKILVSKISNYALTMYCINNIYMFDLFNIVFTMYTVHNNMYSTSMTVGCLNVSHCYCNCIHMYIDMHMPLSYVDGQRLWTATYCDFGKILSLLPKSYVYLCTFFFFCYYVCLDTNTYPNTTPTNTCKTTRSHTTTLSHTHTNKYKKTHFYSSTYQTHRLQNSHYYHTHPQTQKKNTYASYKKHANRNNWLLYIYTYG